MKLEERADFFKALGHPTRLLILHLARIKPRHGEELAAILKLNPATISHHLNKLADAGLLTAKKEQYYQMYSPVEGIMNRTLEELARVDGGSSEGNMETDAYRSKVLQAFFKHGRLTQIPSQRKKRQVVLEKLLEEFEPERDYHDLEVNRILLEFHDDVATIRREFVMTGLMDRTRNTYRRPAPEELAEGG
jgi:biotin operon repressor